MALLATMLVRFRRFRQILIFERRALPDRLILSLSMGAPLTLGVASRILLHYYAADLTLEGAFLVGLIAGPYSGAIVGGLTSVPALIAGEFGALPFAVGCGFAGGGLRELCPKEAIWHFSPFVFTAPAPPRSGNMVRNLHVDWQIILVLAPVAPRAGAPGRGLAVRRPPPLLPGRAVAALFRARAARHGALRRDPDQDLEQRAHRAPAARAGKAAAGRQDLGAGLADQPALPVQHADVDLLADPIAARNGADGRASTVGAAPPAAARSEPLRRRCARSWRPLQEYLDIETIRFGPQLRVADGHRRRRRSTCWCRA